MKPLEPADKEFKFKTPKQERIFKRLCLIGFAPAAYYRDACRLAILDPPLDSISHLLGHLFREIEGMIVNFLLDEPDRKALTNQEGARYGTSNDDRKGGDFLFMPSERVGDCS